MYPERTGELGSNNAVPRLQGNAQKMGGSHDVYLGGRGRVLGQEHCRGGLHGAGRGL